MNFDAQQFVWSAVCRNNHPLYSITSVSHQDKISDANGGRDAHSTITELGAMPWQDLPAGRSICQNCKTLLDAAARTDLDVARTSKNGILIARRGPTREVINGESCVACEIFHGMRSDIETQFGLPISLWLSVWTKLRSAANYVHGAKTPGFDLRAFSFLRTFHGVKFPDVGSHLYFLDTVVIAAVPSDYRGLDLEYGLRHLHWRNGYLLSAPIESKPSSIISGRSILRLFDPHIVQHWIQYCKLWHRCSTEGGTQRPSKLIDCQLRSIGPPPDYATPYTTLSYVWAQVHDVACTPSDGNTELESLGQKGFLPAKLPTLIEDAIKVTLQLGFRYLWVDRYCIDQDDPDEKRNEIHKMDVIYQSSDLTIIAAIKDGTKGLPGVSTGRQSQQIHWSDGDISFISSMPDPQHAIEASRWKQRAWTLQESILARRRLVFTEDQVYFECNAMNCWEGLDVPLDLVHHPGGSHFQRFMRVGLFSGHDDGFGFPLTNFSPAFAGFEVAPEDWSGAIRKFLNLASEYTRRELTFDSDSLNAFAGVSNSLGNVDGLKHRVINLLGIPYLPPSSPGALSTNYFVGSLAWRHFGGWMKGLSDIRRRESFPSWTWAGWAGDVRWDKPDNIVSTIDNLRCELDDGSLVELRRYEGGRVVKALRFDAFRVPPELISLRTSDRVRLGRIAGFKLDVDISISDLNPEEFQRALATGHLFCIFIAQSESTYYFLFLEFCADSASRIGVGRVYSYDNHYKRYCDLPNIFRRHEKTRIRLV